jgi:hypothetical protein
VAGLVGKIREFLAWLKKTGPVEGTTLSKLYEMEGLQEGRGGGV